MSATARRRGRVSKILDIIYLTHRTGVSFMHHDRIPISESSRCSCGEVESLLGLRGAEDFSGFRLVLHGEDERDTNVDSTAYACLSHGNGGLLQLRPDPVSQYPCTRGIRSIRYSRAGSRCLTWLSIQARIALHLILSTFTTCSGTYICIM